MKPILFNIQNMPILAYPLFLGISWGISYVLSHFFINKFADIGIKKRFDFIFIGVFLSAWIGAKLLFLLTLMSASFSYFGSYSFWMGGGFVFYGGLILASVFLLIYFLVFNKRLNILELSLIIPAICFGQGVGRMGCFLTGCCYGNSCSFPWRVYMHGAFRHPVQLYETIFLFGLGVLLSYLILKKKSKILIIFYYFLIYPTGRFILEFFRGDIIRGVDSYNISVSQYISVLIIVINISWFLYMKKILKVKV